MYPPPSDPGQDPALFYRSMRPQPDWPVYREGALLVFWKGISFPPCCLKCGADASGSVRAKLQWHSPWLYLLAIFPGILIYAIAATVVSQRAEVTIPLCEAHRRRRARALAAAWGTMLASLVVPVVYIVCVPPGSRGDGANIVCLGAIAGFFVGLVATVVASHLVTPTFIDERVVKLKGAGKEFLARCPPTV